ncbi:hypothetical protein GCM10027273_36110 [Nocardioides pakistanensis]
MPAIGSGATARLSQPGHPGRAARTTTPPGDGPGGPEHSFPAGGHLNRDLPSSGPAGVPKKRGKVVELSGDQMWDEQWARKGQCRQAPLDAMYVRGAAQNQAKRQCLGCPVKTECLTEALDNRIEWGVWGGMTERERRAVLLRHPDVTSWREFFLEARAAHAAQGRTSAGLGAAARAREDVRTTRVA